MRNLITPEGDEVIGYNLGINADTSQQFAARWQSKANASSRPVRQDAITVLYEVGARDPSLLAPHTEVFTHMIRSRSNLVVWGSLRALAAITTLEPELDATVTPQLYSYLQAAAINQLPTYTECIATHLDGAEVAAYRDIVENCLGVAMSGSKCHRLEAVLKRLPKSDQKRR